LAEGCAFVVEFLEQYEIPYYQGANVGFFVWCDLGAVWRRTSRVLELNGSAEINGTPVLNGDHNANKHG